MYGNVHARSGETLHQDLRYPLMSEDEPQQKFRSLVGLRLQPNKVAELEQKLRAVAEAENVAPLIRGLEVDY